MVSNAFDVRWKGSVHVLYDKKNPSSRSGPDMGPIGWLWSGPRRRGHCCSALGSMLLLSHRGHAGLVFGVARHLATWRLRCLIYTRVIWGRAIRCCMRLALMTRILWFVTFLFDMLGWTGWSAVARLAIALTVRSVLIPRGL